MYALIGTWQMCLDGARKGTALLKDGGFAGDAVEQAIMTVEDEPAYTSVGYGGLPDRGGHVMLDAAYMDGCSPLGVYVRIMIPNIKPVIVTVALLSAIYYWNDYDLASMFMNAAETTPIMVGVANILANVYANSNPVDSANLVVQQNATMICSIAPLVILFLICQKFFIECMDRSGVKG